jgi:bifunctional ADP-heptose synthase (sugar kinase/adenylyltransferase)
MVLVSDYDKGVCKSSLLQAIGNRACAADVPILVDPFLLYECYHNGLEKRVLPHSTPPGHATRH